MNEAILKDRSCYLSHFFISPPAYLIFFL